MCFEGMEESGSEGLDELISEEKDKFFKGVDCVCISGEFPHMHGPKSSSDVCFLHPPISDNYCMSPISSVAVTHY